MAETPKRLYAGLAGDVVTFANDLDAFEKKHLVIEKHISTQVVMIQNPAANLRGINTGQPEMMQTILVSALIIYQEKPAQIS
jgi:hypothetical protein